MALIFRIERTKKIPRITVLRERKKINQRVLPELLGSFNEQRPFDAITAQLTGPERYEFYNFLSTLAFGKRYFQCQADELDRFIFKTPPQFKNALYKIWHEANHYGIEFLPDKEMLLAALNRGKQIEQQLKMLTDGKFSALSELGIDLAEPFLPPTHALHENQKIMAALFNAGLSHEVLADQFNEIASRIGKRPKFTAQYFEAVKEKLLIEGEETFAKWHYALAIEVLKKLEVDLAQVASPAVVTRHWLNLNKQNTLKATNLAFNKAFREFSGNDICHNLIKKSFIDDELVNMGRTPKGKIPSVAMTIEKWLADLEKTPHPPALEKILSMLKTHYPLLSENTYVQQLISQHFK